MRKKQNTTMSPDKCNNCPYMGEDGIIPDCVADGVCPDEVKKPNNEPSNIDLGDIDSDDDELLGSSGYMGV